MIIGTIQRILSNDRRGELILISRPIVHIDNDSRHNEFVWRTRNKGVFYLMMAYDRAGKAQISGIKRASRKGILRSQASAERPTRGAGIIGVIDIILSKAKMLIFIVGPAALQLSCGIATDPLPNSILSYVSDYDTPGDAYRVIIIGDYAYIADGSAGLLILDIFNRYSPEFAAHLATPGPAVDIAISNDYYAYITYTMGDGRHLGVIDVGSPDNPVWVGDFDSLAAFNLKIEVRQRYAYVVAGNLFIIFDITDPARPIRRGSATGALAGCDLGISGNYAGLVNYNAVSGFSELIAVNIADPTNPILQPAANLLADSTIDIFIDDRYLFLAFPDSGMKIADISNISSPSILGGYRSYGRAEAVFYYGGLASYGDGNNGVALLSIIEPAQPEFLGFYDTPGYVRGLFSDGYYLYVADGNRGLLILKIER